MVAATSLPAQLSGPFQHLARAPIVEAVIHWRARVLNELNAESFRSQLRQLLPDYPHIQHQHAVGLAVEVSHGAQHQTSSNVEWVGCRCETQDRRYVAQFARDGLVVSRLTPYENWDRFCDEAMRLWDIRQTLARVPSVDRLGVRFINRIAPVALVRLPEVLTTPPTRPPRIPVDCQEFMHRTTYSIPGQPYMAVVHLASQPASPPETYDEGLILDIDVSTVGGVDDANQREHLQKMRLIKNGIFFSLMTQQVLDQFQELHPK